MLEKLKHTFALSDQGTEPELGDGIIRAVVTYHGSCE